MMGGEVQHKSFWQKKKYVNAKVAIKKYSIPSFILASKEPKQYVYGINCSELVPLYLVVLPVFKSGSFGQYKHA